MKSRIVGIDVARALAVFGMIIVNFKIVVGSEGSSGLKEWVSIFDGKAAATFVVLAGVGIALLVKSSIQKNDRVRLAQIRKKIIKRAVFLFVVGLSYIAIWPADILHYYGVYMSITALVLTQSKRVILSLGLSIVFLFPILMCFMDYTTAWDFETLDYQGFWTVSGFIRNLLYNGFHPVIPWTAFMLFGYWFGLQDLNSDSFIKKAFAVSTSTFLLIKLLSYGSIRMLSNGDPQSAQNLTEILGTSPMPPLPVYMMSGTVIAVSILSACIYLAKRYEQNFLIRAIYPTGQFALTFYVAHVVIGMGVLEVRGPHRMGQYSLTFSIAYALFFCVLCIGFALGWRKISSVGPLEWVMRKITD